jgi:hypothetical protein
VEQWHARRRRWLAAVKGLRRPAGADPAPRRHRTGALVALSGLVVLSLSALAWTLGDSPQPVGAAPAVVYRVTLTPPRAENLTGSSHTLGVLVEQSGDGGATYGPAAGAQPTIAVTPGTTAVTASTCTTPGTDASGRCSVTISSTAPGLTTITASYRGSVASGEGDLATASATKTWVTFRLTVTPPTAVNPTGTAHTFRVAVESDSGNGPRSFAGAQVGLELGGPGQISAITGGSASSLAPDRRTGSCSTDTDGVCAVVITSSDAGTSTLTAVYNASVGTSSGSFRAQAQKIWESPTSPVTAAPTAAATVPTTAAPTTAAPTTAAPTTAAPTTAAPTTAAPTTEAPTTTATTAPATAPVTAAQSATTAGAPTNDTVTAATAPPPTPPTAPITQQQVTPTTAPTSTTATTPVTPPTVPTTPTTTRGGPTALPNTGAVAGVLGALGASLLVLGIAMWTATPRIREHFGRGLR